MYLRYSSARALPRAICWVVLFVYPVTSISAAGIEGSVMHTPSRTQTLRPVDIDLLDDVSRRAFKYFWEQTDPDTGLVRDRALTTGEREDTAHGQISSIAATGFGLTAYCIAADHRWISNETARERVLTTLRFFAHQAPQEHGWFYHFLDVSTGRRAWNSEVSSIDTAILLAGVLTARQYFHDDSEIVDLANEIYSRVDFPWMMDRNHAYFSHGWTPEKGFLPYRWDTYSELLILYVLGIGSPSHPVSPAVWDTWKLPLIDEGNYKYVGGGPLFIHQYSQAWLDLRDRVWSRARSDSRDSVTLISEPPRSIRVNYYANSVAATRAQRDMFAKLTAEFPGYSSNVWGITASDSAKGYTDWGGFASGGPALQTIDGTVAPSASAGSLMFAPDICIPAVRTMLVKYGKEIYGRYGFADAFNPTTGWVSRYVIGIDAGISLISAENLRTGRVWEWFMANEEPEHALKLVGLSKPNVSAATAAHARGSD